jgi:hypothetical protein
MSGMVALMVVASPLGCGTSRRTTTPTTVPGGATSSVASTSVAATAPVSSTSVPAGTGPTTATTSVFGTTQPYQPLYPFRSLGEVAQWQQAYRSGGHDPWHLDAGQTATSFASGHLGYAEIDQVTSTAMDAGGAHIGVGFVSEGGRKATAAVIHLLRFGKGADAPWEVVGTDDTDLTLTAPPYGAQVTSPIVVGGRITGVDESIRVQVRQVSSDKALGESCCVPAGGQRTPWQATVSFSGATDRVVTIAASTGGHLKQVERFTVTGLRA